MRSRGAEGREAPSPPRLRGGEGQDIPHMNSRTIACPHCAAPQIMAGANLQRCGACGQSFYPTPAAADPAVEGRRKTIRVLRDRAEHEAKDSVARYQVLRGCGIFLFVIGLLQLTLGAVLFSGKGHSTVILRHEEPARYWPIVALTFAAGAGLTALGHVALRQIRLSLQRRFPVDEP